LDFGQGQRSSNYHNKIISTLTFELYLWINSSWKAYDFRVLAI